MSEQTDMEYYHGRALCEHELARTAANASVARIHLEMAEHYEKLIEKARASSGQVEINTPVLRFGGR